MLLWCPDIIFRWRGHAAKSLQNMEKEHCTYSSMFSRDPFVDCSITLGNPPTRADPWMRTVKNPTIMTTIWNASVHTTAFNPPWMERIDVSYWKGSLKLILHSLAANSIFLPFLPSFLPSLLHLLYFQLIISFVNSTFQISLKCVSFFPSLPYFKLLPSWPKITGINSELIS